MTTIRWIYLSSERNSRHTRWREKFEKRAPKEEECCIQGTPSILEEDEDTDEEEFAMVVRKVGRMFYKQGIATIEEQNGKERVKERKKLVCVFIVRSWDI